MTAHGALIVIMSIVAGMWLASTRGLDGAQTFIACAFAWMVISACYHAAGGVLSLFSGRRRRR